MNTMTILSTIENTWGWKGVQPEKLVMQNAFGNVIFVDRQGIYWRICPEELSCNPIAEGSAAFEQLRLDPDFLDDWSVERFVEKAEAALGQLTEDRCYCLKIPAVLGGQYSVENFGTIGREEVISSAGDIASQIEDLPDGAKTRFRVVD